MVVLLAGSAGEETGWAPRAALAVVRGWARGGERVVLADLGLDAPALHALLGEENGEGITDALLYGSSVQRIARRPTGERFALIPAGTPVSDPAGVLAHPRWGSLAAGFREAGVVLAVYLPSSLPGAEALARRVSLRVLLGPGGELLGNAPVLARLQPTGHEAFSVQGEVELGEEPFEEPAGEPTQGDAEAPVAPVAHLVDSMPPERMTPAAVPALHRWVGSPPAAPSPGTLTADLPEDFSPGAAARSEAPQSGEAGVDAEPADPPAPGGDPDQPGPEGFRREEWGEDLQGPPVDPFDFLPVQEGAVDPPPPWDEGVDTPWEVEEEALDGWTPDEPAPAFDEADPAPVVPEVTPEPAFPAAEPDLASDFPPVPPAPREAAVPVVGAPVPRRGEPRRRSPVALLLLLLLLLLALLGAARMGFLSIPGVTPPSDPGSARPPGTSTAQAAVPTGASMDVEVDSRSGGDEGPAIPASPAHVLALALNAYSTASGARAAAARLRAALPRHPVVVAPVDVGGQTFHRLLVTGITGPEQVATVRREVAPAFPQGDPEEWIVRNAGVGFLLGEEGSAASARARVEGLDAVGVPSYILEVQYGDGSRGYRIIGGAYASESEASALAALLRSVGEGEAPLVSLAGRPPT